MRLKFLTRRRFLKIVGTSPFAIQILSQQTRQGKHEQIIEEIEARIERYRKGELNIELQANDGTPLKNAELTLEQQRHAFLFGCNIFRLGRILNSAHEEAYRQQFKAVFNYATIGFYWNFYERVRGKPIYEYTDAVVDWCRTNGIICKGHPLVWDDPASSPDHWLPDDVEEIKKLSIQRVEEIIKRYSGRIDIWDVVNEPTDLTRNKTKMNRLANKLGPIPYTVLHLQVARKANPQAILLVNDYRTDEAYFKILEQLKDESGQWLFDVVGIQSHMHGGVWSATQIWRICERFAQLGLPLHFTETTILSGSREGNRWGETNKEAEEKQAEATVRFYTLLFSHPAVQAITWWDFSDDGAWQRAPAGWLRRDMSPKPVYHRMRELIKDKWWTKENGVTNSNGQWHTRAYFGDYKLHIRLSSGYTKTESLSLKKGAENNFKIIV